MIEELDIAIFNTKADGFEGTNAALHELKRQYLESMIASQVCLREEDEFMRARGESSAS